MYLFRLARVINIMILNSHHSNQLKSNQFTSITGVVEPVPMGQAAKDYLAKAVNPTLLKGLTDLCKQKPQDPVVC